MRKCMKKLLGAVLTVTMCLALVPAQAAKAEEKPTEEQLKKLCYGTWNSNRNEQLYTMSEKEYKIENGEDTLLVEWSYVGLVESYGAVEGGLSMYGAEALHFTSEANEYYVFIDKDLVEDEDTGVLGMEKFIAIRSYVSGGLFENGCMNEVGIMGEKKNVSLGGKLQENGEVLTVEQALAKILTEAPKTEAGGREVLEGESVYVVKKGDCLWSIARDLLGSGYKYKELFTRNGDIIENAREIFEGQEIIVPAK